MTRHSATQPEAFYRRRTSFSHMMQLSTCPHLTNVDESWRMLIHDVRNPLATAHVYVQLLRGRAARAHLQPTDLDQGLQRIEDAVAQIERLLNCLNQRPEVPATGGTDLIKLARQMATQADPAERITVLPQTETVIGNLGSR